jgi:uncharacterized membrane protein YgdD (TMEM256/DUF423 family)
MDANAVRLAIAAVYGLVAVALGATASHLLGADLRAAALAATASLYAIYHALALLGVAALEACRGRDRMLDAAAWLFVAGVALFSGALVALAFTGLRAAAHVAPFGGVAMMLGWAALVIYAVRAATGAGARGPRR